MIIFPVSVLLWKTKSVDWCLHLDYYLTNKFDLEILFLELIYFNK